MTYSAPVDFTISAETSPVYAPFSWSAQFSAATLIGEPLSNSATVARWINGVPITTAHEGFFTASFNSVANATPSCRFLFIFQLPATILILAIFYNCFKLCFSVIIPFCTTISPGLARTIVFSVTGSV